MGQALFIENGQVVEVIANYGDGGILVEYKNGDRELVGRSQVEYISEAKKPAKSETYTGPIPEVEDETFLEEWTECCSEESEVKTLTNIVNLLENQLKERDEEFTRVLIENREMKKALDEAESRLVQAGKDIIESMKESIRQQNEVEKQLKRANKIIDYIIQE